MSEQTTEQPNVEDVTDETTEEANDTDVSEEAEEASDEEQLPPLEEQPWYDEVFPVLLVKAVKLGGTVNTEVTWLKQHSTDLLTVIESIEADESDEKIKAANAKIEELKDQLLEVEQLRRNYAKSVATKVISERDDSEAIKAHEEAHAKARTAYRDYLKVFKSNYEGADITPYLPEVHNLTRKGGGGKGSGGSRMRGFSVWTVDGKRVGGNVDGEFKSTASDAAKAAGIDLSELQNEYKRLHGDDSKSWPQDAEFEFKGHKFSAHRPDPNAAKESADVSPAANESTNGTATS